MITSELLKQAESISRNYFNEKISKEFYFHSLSHTEEVVLAAKILAKAYRLAKNEVNEILLSLWFHDLGFSEGRQDHERRSAQIAEDFLKEHKIPEEVIERIKRFIEVTKQDVQPQNIKEEIIKDADTSHIGNKGYLRKLGLLRSEWQAYSKEDFDEKAWLNLNLEFLHQHSFYSSIAQSKFNERKRKNILKLQGTYKNLINFERNAIDLNNQSENENLLSLPKKADRGVETMFRVTLRNHNHLSQIADNKANIMLSINAIMLSIVFSSLIPKIDSNAAFMVPTILIIIMCIVCIVFATLSTRPKITSANYTDEKFLDKRFNILFFGNFYQLPLDKFEWAIGKLMRDEELLYGSLTKDLYYLGLVLTRKYKYLRITYNVFVVGLIVVGISFIVALQFNNPD
jgi:predicted metal-dependent HD superfamily phosphohydrolase